jgi:hypothetical protein
VSIRQGKGQANTPIRRSSMKRLLAALLFTSAMTGAAFAYTTTGTVSSWDHANRTLALNNGETFTIPSDVDGPAIRKGEKLTITYDSRTAHHVTGVTPAVGM